MARKKRPVKILTLDTETYGFEGAIKRIAVYDGEEITYGYKFADVEPVLEYYFREGFSVHVYIHNMEFDLRKMPELFRTDNVNWDQTKLISGRYAVLACRKYTLHDSFRIMPRSLEYLSESFNLEHGKMDLMEEVNRVYPGQYKDKGDYFIRCDKDDPVYVKYLGYDVISLYELIEKLCDISGITIEEFVPRISTASLSRYLLKNGFKGKKFIQEGSKKTDFELITLCKAWRSDKPIKDNFGSKHISYIQIEEKLRAAYFGGRTEVFTPRIKKKPGREIHAYHCDRNSMYPAEMIDNYYPIGYPEYDDHPKFVRYAFEDWQKGKVPGLGFIHCVVHIPQQFIPPLPVNMGKLVFPTGVIEGTWTYPELDYAVKNCGVEVLEWKEVIYFKKTSKVFHEFIKTFSTIKSEAKANGESALEWLAKNIQNVGYGWTALRRDDKTELHENTPEKVAKYAERLLYENEELGFIECEADVRTDTIQVQIAAYVTSYARINLLDLMRKQAEKGDVYYCDTDSIVSEYPLPEEVLHKTKLGAWDVEGLLLDGVFISPKVYAEITEKKTNIKFKGVTKDTQKSFTFSFYERILNSLITGAESEIKVEEDKLLLRSMKYSQKTGTDPNRAEHRDKYMYLTRKQKRNMNYAENYSMPWYFETLQQFKTFSFAEPVIPHKVIGDLIP